MGKEQREQKGMNWIADLFLLSGGRLIITKYPPGCHELYAWHSTEPTASAWYPAVPFK